jgi:hypothetical protein
LAAHVAKRAKGITVGMLICIMALAINTTSQVGTSHRRSRAARQQRVRASLSSTCRLRPSRFCRAVRARASS